MDRSAGQRTPRRSRSISPSAKARFFGLLIDDPNDDSNRLRYHAHRRPGADGPGGQSQAQAGAPPAPAENYSGASRWRSNRAAIKTPKVYFRLFDLKPDGSDFFLYYTRPGARLTVPHAEVVAERHGADFYRQWRELSLPSRRIRPNLSQRRCGGAEARYLETVIFAQHQLMETNRWAMENLPWDIYLAYTPFSRRSGARVARLSRLDPVRPTNATSPSTCGRF